MTTRAVPQLMTNCALTMMSVVAMAIGIPAFSDWEDEYCDEQDSPAHCNWGNGEDCSTQLSNCGDFCDRHGGVDVDACDEIGGSCYCLS